MEQKVIRDWRIQNSQISEKHTHALIFMLESLKITIAGITIVYILRKIKSTRVGEKLYKVVYKHKGLILKMITTQVTNPNNHVPSVWKQLQKVLNFRRFDVDKAVVSLKLVFTVGLSK